MHVALCSLHWIKVSDHGQAAAAPGLYGCPSAYAVVCVELPNAFGHAAAAPRSSEAPTTSTPLTRVDSAGTRLVVHMPCTVAACLSSPAAVWLAAARRIRGRAPVEFFLSSSLSRSVCYRLSFPDPQVQSWPDGPSCSSFSLPDLGLHRRRILRLQKTAALLAHATCFDLVAELRFRPPWAQEPTGVFHGPRTDNRKVQFRFSTAGCCRTTPSPFLSSPPVRWTMRIMMTPSTSGKVEQARLLPSRFTSP